MDRIDRKILLALQNDASISIAELSSRVAVRLASNCPRSSCQPFEPGCSIHGVTLQAIQRAISASDW